MGSSKHAFPRKLTKQNKKKKKAKYLIFFKVEMPKSVTNNRKIFMMERILFLLTYSSVEICKGFNKKTMNKKTQSVILNSEKLFQLAKDAYFRSKQIDDALNKKPRNKSTYKNYVYPTAKRGDPISSIVFSVSTLEAFIEEILALIKLYFIDDTEKNIYYSKETSYISLMEEAENSKSSLNFKYLFTAAFWEKPFDKGIQPYQDFDALVKIRNKIIHLKQDHEHQDSVNFIISNHKLPSFLKILQPKKILTTYSCHWFDRIDTPLVAKWACETALSIINYILEIFPQDSICGNKIRWTFKKNVDFSFDPNNPSNKGFSGQWPISKK